MISPTEDSKDNHYSRRFRVTRLKYAVISSVASKIATLIAQFIALPLAARALGEQQFALYSVLVAGTAWISIANIGVGPPLVTAITAANAESDQEKQAILVSNAFYPVFGISIIILLLALYVILFFPNLINLSSIGETYEDTARWGALILISIITGRSVLSVFEAVQAGFQELHHVNIRSFVGNVISILAIALVAYNSPTVVGMILAVNIPLLTAQVINIWLLLRKRPYLFPQLSRIRQRFIRLLILPGLVFSLAGTIGSFINHQMPIVLIGNSFGTKATILYTVYMNIFILAFGLISMLGIPIWSTLSDSLARHDYTWAKSAYRNVLCYSIFYAVCVAVAILLLGNEFLSFVFGEDFQGSTSLALGFAVYFIVDVWEYVHYMFLIGMGKVKMASLIYFARSMLFLLLTLAIINFGPDSLIWGLVLSVILITSWLFPFLVVTDLRRRCETNTCQCSSIM